MLVGPARIVYVIDLRAHGWNCRPSPRDPANPRPEGEQLADRNADGTSPQRFSGRLSRTWRPQPSHKRFRSGARPFPLDEVIPRPASRCHDRPPGRLRFSRRRPLKGLASGRDCCDRGLGVVSKRGQMAHFATGAWLMFAVEMEMHALDRDSGRPVWLTIVPDI